MNPIVVTMSGPEEIYVPALSNFEAGIAFLTVMNKLAPGITFGELAAAIDGTPGRMAGWWTDLKHAAGDIKDGVGDVLVDTGKYLAGAAGDSVRLVTDEKVIDGASRLGTAYATSGGSEGVRGVLGSAAQPVLDFISSLGASFKGQAAAASASPQSLFSANALPWVMGGGLLLVLLLRRSN